MNKTNQKYNLELELLTNNWMLKKVRDSKIYAQNLYAALCNTDWCKNDPFELLTENSWHCSWRHAGAIVAEMRQEGEYTDWYCSGIMPNAHQVSEGRVTQEIRQDLLKLGWVLVASDDF